MSNNALPVLVVLNEYDVEEGKLAASVRWLITRVFEREVPDKLKNAVYRDEEERLQLTTAILTALTNGSLYGQAAARIVKDSSIIQQRPSAILSVLSALGIPVHYRQSLPGGVEGPWEQVSEAHLMSAEPFIQKSHTAMIDALMQLQVRITVTIERTIEAVSRYTTVEEQERPVDPTDALLFWINKICLLVRDDVEKRGHLLKGGEDGLGGAIPEMEDLYEDLCDGCCLAALLSFYRPDMMAMTEICFNDPISVEECQYNLLLIQRFCATALPYNIWHFSTEDVLYMPEGLQPNINCFLAELFEFLEPARLESDREREEDDEEEEMLREAVAEESEAPPLEVAHSPRRFLPLQVIPDLRATNAAGRPQHPPKVRYPTVPRPPRSMSVMSADSLANSRTPPTLSARMQEEQQWGQNVTGFGEMQTPDVSSNGNIYSNVAMQQQPTASSSSYNRSDSMPIASIRLALEEKRREHERKKAIASTMSESERVEKGKAAFFALMQKHGKGSVESSPAPSLGEGVSTASNVGSTSNEAAIAEHLNRQLEELREKVERMNEEREGERIARATSQPSIYHDINGASMPQMPPVPMSQPPSSARTFSQAG